MASVARKEISPSVLIVEDEQAIVTVLQYHLKKYGYVSEAVSDGNQAIDEIKRMKPDVVLLDWMLPGRSGLEICKCVREDKDIHKTPIIMISARGEEFDKIAGLDEGADDYLVKPFSPEELASRIRAILRRTREVIAGSEITFGDIKIKLKKQEVIRNGRVLRLSPLEYKIFLLLVDKEKDPEDPILGREEMLRRIWGNERNVNHVGARTVDVHITRLRKALLGASSDNRDIIRTVRNRGYTLASEITSPSDVDEKKDEV
jgi:two-component system phosphate regulon response regulator PhoB